MLKVPSLAARLTLSSAIVLPVILAFSAFALDRAFWQSLLNAEQQALHAHLYSLMGAAEPASELEPNQYLLLPDSFAEPRFNRPQSGLSGLVIDANGETLWSTASFPVASSATAAGLPQPLLSQFDAGSEQFIEQPFADGDYFMLSFDSIWEVRGKEQLYRFIVLHDQQPLKAELRGYRDALWVWLGGIALLFVAAQFFITRWGLQPLKALARELKLFQQGNKNSMDGDYPAEIAPVIHNLNELLTSEQAQRQRYKNTLSDLAHSLKTPLAIIRAEIESKSTTRDTTIDEQITRMADIVQHQLQRATLTTTTSIRVKTPLAATLKRLTDALQKVYREKDFTVTLAIDDTINFPGDEGDAMEVFGNLVENAFKYGKNAISIEAQTRKKELVVSIADNGSGIPDNLQQQILHRGARADTSLQGQGIGLSVVVDILSSYQGQLEVGNCEKLGGAKFTLSIPL